MEGWLETDDGLRLYYQALGEGARGILIPNGMHMLEDFARFASSERRVVIYDVRNRGRSETVDDPAKRARGVQHDVEDVDAVRRHFGLERVNLIGHSYCGMTVMLYALAHPSRVERAVVIGSVPPQPAKQYPAHLTGADAVMGEVFTKMAEVRKEAASLSPEEFCRKLWSVLRPLYVADPANAEKIRWERCELPNEVNFMKYWQENILPSLQAITLSREQLAAAKMPVLLVHGRKDRSAPYGGARDWAFSLPEARLLTVDDAAHAPWIERPALVMDALETFLGGAWPAAAEQVTGGVS